MKRWLLLVSSAVLYLAAFPPLNLGLLVFVALVPLLLALDGATARESKLLGFVWGFNVVGFQMIWIPKLVTQWTGNAPLGILPLLVCAVIGGGYYVLVATLLRRCLELKWWWALVFVWVGFEVVRSYIPGLAFPFFLTATPLWPYPALIQSAFIGTVYLVSAWVVVINILALFFLTKVSFKATRPYIAVSVIILVSSLLRFTQPIKGTATRITAGQPGVDMAFTARNEQDAKLFGNVEYISARARGNRSKLLVLPEGVAQSDGFGVPVTPFRVDPDLPILFGGMRVEMSGEIKKGTTMSSKRYQSAFTLNKGKWEHVDKARLVVFGEYVPGRNFIPFLSQFKLSDQDLTPGAETKSITAGGIKVGPMICFEGLFWDVAHKQSENGAQMLAVMSLDDWYMGTPAPDQLRTAAVWRAVETGLPVVRAASTGYTMGVDQRGKIINEAPLGKAFALHLRVYLEDNPVKVPTRALFPWAFGIAFPIVSVLLWRRRSAA
ncbi:MAG: apolipoprotein N-acyltransferase [Fimbriimonadaceae bacterium]